MGQEPDNARCLVIGANGLVGTCLTRILGEAGLTWKGTFRSRPKNGLIKLDITDPRAANELLLKVAPDVIFHCANLAGGVDYCESHPGIAADFHLRAVQTLGSLCEKMGSEFVFVSSDYIFDGTKGPYKEDDKPNPLNVYGKVKLAAEEWVTGNVKRRVIIRTTNVFGWDPQSVTPNYMMGLYAALKAGKRFNAPSFLWGNPTYAGDLAKAMMELYLKDASGCFHVVGPSIINRFEWAKRACGIFGLDAGLLDDINAPSPNMVPRPLKSLLNTDKFTSSYKTVLHDVSKGLALMKEEIDG